MAAAGALPCFAELIAPPTWRTIDFISDLHLADDTPHGFDAWAAYLGSTGADAVFMLGDLFEAWIGDDSRHSGFEARCVDVLSAASRRIELAFMVGNRDFLLGAEMLAACGVRQLADPTVLTAFGRRLLLSHGDALCLSDVAYQQLRRTVRQPAWQAAALAQPLAARRALARQMRDESHRHQANQPAGEWFDVDRGAALAWMQAADAPDFIHGHTHRPGSELLAPGFTRHVLSDWEFDHTVTPRADVLRWQAGGLSRLSPEATATAR